MEAKKKRLTLDLDPTFQRRLKVLKMASHGWLKSQRPMLRCLPIVVIRLLLAISRTASNNASMMFKRRTRHCPT